MNFSAYQRNPAVPLAISFYKKFESNLKGKLRLVFIIRTVGIKAREMVIKYLYSENVNKNNNNNKMHDTWNFLATNLSLVFVFDNLIIQGSFIIQSNKFDKGNRDPFRKYKKIN